MSVHIFFAVRSFLAIRRVSWGVAAVGLLAACGDMVTENDPDDMMPAGPAPVAEVRVSPDSVSLFVGGTAPLVAALFDASGTTLADRTVTWTVTDAAVASVSDSGIVTAMAPGVALVVAAIEGIGDTATITVRAPQAPSTISITTGPSDVRQGDVVTYAATGQDGDGNPWTGAQVNWSLVLATAGLLTTDGRFVGYVTGTASIVAAVPGAADTLVVTITARNVSGSFSVVGRGPVTDRWTSDLWVYGDYAYTGTWSNRGGVPGNTVYVWNISVPSAPVLTDSVIVDASTTNDVKVRADGAIAVVTHEGSSDGLNGITLLDLTDPASPTVITRFTTSLTGGVHNVWIEGDYVYAATDGSGLQIIDVTTPATPAVVAAFFAGSSSVHDVYVRDGLAFVSYWNAGLIILDVGNGIASGSPGDPVEVGRIVTAGGQTHNAWYWPDAGYVFVGEEDFGTPGIIHVVDVADLANPIEVATFASPGATPHNFWLDESQGILYVGWYGNGVRAIDVSGTLLGQLERQGREIAGLRYETGGACVVSAATCTWAPQLHNGRIFVSDLNSGLWVLEVSF